MSGSFLIENVECYSQKDNKYKPYVSCFPTSVAMVMNYCLNFVGTDKSIIGCSNDMQLEDYINYALDDNLTTAWMKKNTPVLGSWIWKYNRRTIYKLEEYIFNRFMNFAGFKATFLENEPYDSVCDKLEESELPMIIGGNFSSVSSVHGHINTMVGFNRIGVKQVINNDPYGNALKGFKGSGKEVIYPIKFFIKKKKEVMNVIHIEKTFEA